MSAEKLEMMQTQMTEEAKRGGSSAKMMTETQADALMVSLGGTIMVKAAHSSYMHLRDVDLKVSELTNKVEMGLRPKLELTAEQLDWLDKQLERPMKKSTQFVQKLKDEASSLDTLWKSKSAVQINGRSHDQAMSFVQKAISSADAALAGVTKMRTLLRAGPEKTNQAMEALMDFRANVDALNSLDPIFQDPEPAKKK